MMTSPLAWSPCRAQSENYANEAARLPLQDVQYIGPIRSPAKRYYLAQLDAQPGMDPAGEFLPYVLGDIREAYRAWHRQGPDLTSSQLEHTHWTKR